MIKAKLAMMGDNAALICWAATGRLPGWAGQERRIRVEQRIRELWGDRA